MTRPSGQDIAQWIAAGDLDFELSAVYDALSARFSEGAVGLTWSVVIPDLDVSISEDDLTIDEAMMIEKMTGTTWASIDPVRTAADARAVLAVALSQRCGLTVDEAEEKLKTVRAADYLKGVKREVVTPAPLDSDD